MSLLKQRVICYLLTVNWGSPDRPLLRPSLSRTRAGVARALCRNLHHSSVRFRRGAYLLRSYIPCSLQSAGEFGFVFPPVILRIHPDVCPNQTSRVTPEVE